MNRALRMLPVVGLVIGVVAINERASGVVNGQVPAVDDTRFDAVAAFSLTDWLNGVTFEHNHFGNGTLIAPDTMVMAKHLLPSNAEYGTQPPSGYYSFRFRRNPDGSLGTIAQGWQSFYHVPVVKFIYPDQRRYPDVVFAKLASPVTHITPMGVAPQGKVAALAVGASTITFAGWGTTGPGFG
ncbi:MAG TPA: hypothetical protein VG797_10905, partial [Phycisphaerales bacterium]|nr:hypothetical protein [Phycisphaerales bacterium]